MRRRLPPKLSPKVATAACLAVVALVAAVLAGCGGGKSGGGDNGPAVGSVIRNVRARQVAPTRVLVTGTLTRPGDLSLVVTRLGGANPVDLGKLREGRKPKGAFRIAWDKTVGGTRVPPGKYRLVVYGESGEGRSQPMVVTVPGAAGGRGAGKAKAQAKTAPGATTAP